MSKLRLLFVKEGPASYISNLDLLRTVQRAFPPDGAGHQALPGLPPPPHHLHRPASAGGPVQRLRAAGF